ncbi:NUDIX domain-containing protein [Brevibacterium daeguense]|uniref:NUDIX domain-containing protein n=1 Tax=Brevibacterium daeguense TaxID=909936 RepID=A0ABP8EHT2_9MICO|nr:NUDIX hydrolase [Brevibacterium daeguense]
MVRELKTEGSDRSDQVGMRTGVSLASNLAAPGVEMPVRPAVSVIVARDTARGLEVFVQHRVKTMDFAAGVVVYPGGRVDPQDHEAAAALDVPDSLVEEHVAAWSRTELGADPTFARALIATAQREVGEEAGATIPPSALKPWANWITPPGRTKRFDTYFYVARGDQIGDMRHQTTEATMSEWMNVEQILREEAAERLKLMRPTLVLLNEVHHLGSVDALISAQREIEPVRPFMPGKHG